jgi:hypothetical protein
MLGDDLHSKMPDLRSKMSQPPPDLRAKLTAKGGGAGVKDLRARLGQRAAPAPKQVFLEQ